MPGISVGDPRGINYEIVAIVIIVRVDVFDIVGEGNSARPRDVTRAAAAAAAVAMVTGVTTSISVRVTASRFYGRCFAHIYNDKQKYRLI